MRGFFLIILLILFVLPSFENLSAYDRLNKRSRAYYYTQKYPYGAHHAYQRDRRAYKSYFYYDHNIYPQYTYTYPGYYHFYGYPHYYHNDNGVIYSYWGFR